MVCLPTMQANRSETAFEPTEVAQELAASFAPMPKAITIAIMEAEAISHSCPSLEVYALS